MFKEYKIDNNYPIKRLILVGNSIVNLNFILQYARSPIPNLEVYFISEYFYVPYNKMVPDYLTTHFSFSDSHIDLVSLARYAKCIFINSSIKSINANQKTLILNKGITLCYDVLFLNLEATNNKNDDVISVSPVPVFLKKTAEMISDILQKLKIYNLAIVGDNASTIEMALVLNYRVRLELKKNVRAFETFKISIFTKNKSFFNQSSDKNVLLAKILKYEEIKIYFNKDIKNITNNSLICEDGEIFKVNKILLYKKLRIDSEWLLDSKLKLDKQGYPKVNAYLQSESHQDVFIDGDFIDFNEEDSFNLDNTTQDHEVDTALNIRRYFLGEKLRKSKKKISKTNFIKTGNKSIIAIFESFTINSRIIWYYKVNQEKKFISKYQNLPFLKNKKKYWNNSLFIQNKKIGYYPLGIQNYTKEYFSKNLSKNFKNEIDILTEESAAIIYKNKSQHHYQSFNFLTKCIPDLYIFGQLVANHCLNDIYASSSTPDNAFAIVYLKNSIEKIAQNNFDQMISGAEKFFSDHSVRLLGSYKFFGNDKNSFGIIVNGTGKEVKNNKIATGDLIVVTKPLGARALLNSYQQNTIKASWYKNLLDYFLQSNRAAYNIIKKTDYSICIRVAETGFLNSLFIKIPKAFNFEINLEAIPLLSGFRELKDYENNSIQQDKNINLWNSYMPSYKEHYYPEVFEPQICGPLLVVLPPKKARLLVTQLKKANYSRAAVVGKIKAKEFERNKIILK